MDSTSIQLADSLIDGVDLEPDLLRVRFSRAIIIKTMTGSAEKTLWWQAGDLLLQDPEPEAELPVGAATCTAGDIDDNIYTYRDMIPLPLESRGRIRCALQFSDAPPLVVSASGIRLQMHDTPKYQRHLRGEEAGG
jgi:hypothetical protein